MTTDIEVSLDKAGVEHLAAVLHGRIIPPGNADYDAARKLWNGMIDRYPALIARCAGVADVRHVLSFARENGHAGRVLHLGSQAEAPTIRPMRSGSISTSCRRNELGH